MMRPRVRSPLGPLLIMHRFYFANANFEQKHLTIKDVNEIHHIKDVLRLKQGEPIQIFNNQNQEADTVIESISQDEILVRIQSLKEAPLSRTKIILACAPPKKDKFEWIIEKCTELGVDEIIPLRTKRGEVTFSKEKMASKLSRFEKVIVNAAKQSKRIQMPKVQPMTDLVHVIKNLDPQGIHLFPSLNGHPLHIKEVLSEVKQAHTITIFIGPEGDFTPDEARLAQENGCMPVSLGSTVLKVETAAIAVVSFVRFIFKD